MSVYIVVLFYFSVSLLLSKCTETRTLNSVYETETESGVIGTLGYIHLKKGIEYTDTDCEQEIEVNIKKAHKKPKHMDGFVACEYFSDNESC